MTPFDDFSYLINFVLLGEEPVSSPKILTKYQNRLVYWIPSFQTIEDFILLVGTFVAFVAFILWCCFPIQPKVICSSEILTFHSHNTRVSFRTQIIANSRAKPFTPLTIRHSKFTPATARRPLQIHSCTMITWWEMVPAVGPTVEVDKPVIIVVPKSKGTKAVEKAGVFAWETLSSASAVNKVISM